MAKYSNHVQKKDESVFNVYKTTDYEKFKILTGNRKTNDLHLQRLVNSFLKKYLISPIIVNEKWQIIDGQHRYLAAKEMGLPLYYIVLKNYGLEEVQILNTNSSNWKKEDYLKAYCDLKVPSYLSMRKFMSDFPDFGIQVSEQLLTNLSGGVNNVMDESKGRVKYFQEGKLKIPNILMSYENAEKIMMFKKYYDGYNRSTFVSAMIGIFKNENYNHAEMLNKLEHNPTSLQDCTNVTQYKLLIEEIYNFRRREKVNLRF